jgi:hypothetical protein
LLKKRWKIAAFKSDFANWGYLNIFSKAEYFNEIHDLFAGI